MLTKCAAAGAFVVFPLLLLLSLYTGNIRVETAQPNGLAEIRYPYSVISLVAFASALGSLFFGIALSASTLRGGVARPAHRLVGSGLFASGVLAILFSGLLFWIDQRAYGLRCIAMACQPYVQQDFQAVVTNTTIGVFGMIAAGFGLRLLIRRGSASQNFVAESRPELPSGHAHGP